MMLSAPIASARSALKRLSRWFEKRIFSNPITAVRLVQGFPHTTWDYYVYQKRRYWPFWTKAHFTDSVNECRDYCNELSHGMFGLQKGRTKNGKTVDLPILLEYNCLDVKYASFAGKTPAQRQ